MRTTLHNSPLAQRGSMLLEGLIAILIFSVGILAIVGMQATAIKNSADAKYRADASYLANQIIGQMWADRGNLASYAHYAGGTTPCSPTGSASTYANVSNWLNAVASAVPGTTIPGTNRQQIVIGTGNTVKVTVCWKAPQDNVQHWLITNAQING